MNEAYFNKYRITGAWHQFLFVISTSLRRINSLLLKSRKLYELLLANNLGEVVRLLLSWAFSPKLLFKPFIYVENDGADGAIREGLIRPEDKLPLVQMRIRTAVARPIFIDCAEIILQKRTR